MNTVLAQVTVTTSSSGDMGAVSPIVWVVYLIFLVAMIAAVWRIFTKAGRPGWASIIPIYNTIVMLQITGKSAWWILGLLVPFLNIFVGIRLIFNLASVFGRGIGFGFGLLFLSPIFLLILGFGKSEYVGPNGSGRATAASGGYAAAPMA